MLKLTMENVNAGLSRFHRDMNPARITYGDIWRVDISEDGLRCLDRMVDKIDKNITLAQTFLDECHPSDLERLMVNYFQESCSSSVAECDRRRAFIEGFLEADKCVAERIDQYDQARMMLPPRRGEKELPF